MKTVEIDRYSWFNRKLDKFHMDINWNNLDFCTYMQKVAVFVAMTGVMMMVILAGSFAIGIQLLHNTDFVKTHSLWIVLPVFLLSGMALLGAVVGTLVGIVVGIYSGVENIRAGIRRRKLAQGDKEPSPIGLAYLALRKKMCVKVVLKR